MWLIALTFSQWLAWYRLHVCLLSSFLLTVCSGEGRSFGRGCCCFFFGARRCCFRFKMASLFFAYHSCLYRFTVSRSRLGMTKLVRVKGVRLYLSSCLPIIALGPGMAWVEGICTHGGPPWCSSCLSNPSLENSFSCDITCFVLWKPSQCAGKFKSPLVSACFTNYDELCS